MHEFSVNVGQLREALHTLSEYRPREREYYDRELYEDGTYAGDICSSHDYYFDNKARFDVSTHYLRLSIVCKGYTVQITIPCESNESDVSFCFQLNTLLRYIENYDPQESKTFVEERFFGYNGIQAYSAVKWPEYPVRHAPDTFPAPTQWLPYIVETFKNYEWEHPEAYDRDFIWINIEDGKCTYWCSQLSWIYKRTIPVDYPDVRVFSLHRTICMRLQHLLQETGCGSMVLSELNGCSIISCDDVLIAMRKEGTIHRKSPINELSTIDNIYSRFAPDGYVRFKTKKLRSFISRAKVVCDSRPYLLFHLKDNYLFCHSYDLTYRTAINEYIPLSCEKKMEKIWRVRCTSLENMLSDIHSDYCKLLYVSEGDPGPFYLSSIQLDEEKGCYRICDAGKPIDDDNIHIDFTEKNLYALIEKNKINNQMPGDVLSFEIGKKFPYPIEVGRDSILPVPTYDGLSVIMTYCNLTQQEIKSILDEPCKIGLVQLGIIPFMVFNFNNVIQQDISLNIQKLKEKERIGWMEDSEHRLITLYLVEGTDGTLVGIRMFDLSLLDDLRSICRYQLDSKMEEIDYMIQVNESMYDIHRMWSKAFKIEDVDAPFVL